MPYPTGGILSSRLTMSNEGGPSGEQVFGPFSTTEADAFIAGLGIVQTFPGVGHCYVTNAVREPWSDNQVPEPGTSNYAADKLQVRVSYELGYYTQPWPSDIPKPVFRAGTELRMSVRGSVKFLTYPLSATAVDDGSRSPGDETAQEVDEEDPKKPDDEEGVVSIGISEFTITWDKVLNPPINRFRAFLNTVNWDWWLGGEAETMMFDSFEVTDTAVIDYTNPHRSTVTCMFSSKRIIDVAGGRIVGWNHVLKEDGWKTILRKPEKVPLFDLKDYNGMFI